MRHHWNYLKYVLKHKYFVFKAGRKLRVPLWRLLIHDWSKFTRAEWTPYVNSFYRFKHDRTFDVRNAFDKAWLHHIHHNPHHNQYWLLRQDDGQTRALDMPEKFVREMIADWMGAGKAITGKWEVLEWYEKKKDIMILHERTRTRVKSLLKTVEVYD